MQSRASPHMSDSREKGRIRIKPAIRGKAASRARLLVLALSLGPFSAHALNEAESRPEPSASNAGPSVPALQRTLRLMQEAGMTPMQIIVTATKNAAHVCNLEATLGTLERGKVADVLVVNGDPLQDLHAFTNVRLVVRSGTIIRDAGN